MDRSPVGFLGMVLALAIAALACSAPTPLPTPAPQQLPTGKRILHDDFHDEALGWDKVEDVEGLTTYADNGYKIQIKANYAILWATPKAGYEIPADVIIGVRARSTGNKENYFGLVCRYQDVGNFYFLVISADGYYGIGKVFKGEHSLINRSEMPPSEAFDGNQEVTLRAECTGNRLALFANGILLDEQTDSSFNGGYVGLLAASYTEEVTVLFDDYDVYELAK